MMKKISPEYEMKQLDKCRYPPAILPSPPSAEDNNNKVASP